MNIVNVNLYLYSTKTGKRCFSLIFITFAVRFCPKIVLRSFVNLLPGEDIEAVFLLYETEQFALASFVQY